MDGLEGFIDQYGQSIIEKPKSKILDFVVNNRLKGIDRIVPVGRALDIDVIWDGFDIEKNLSRMYKINFKLNKNK